jgi:CheY-like chemotaxis protein
MREPNRKISGVSTKPLDVIVVEDDDGSRAMLGALFETIDCTVRSFASADTALDSALSHAPDVVLTDLDLGSGRATGWILAELMRREPRTAHVGLIAISGKIEPETHVVHPFDAYVRKPVETVRLLSLVTQLAEVSRTARARRASAG